MADVFSFSGWEDADKVTNTKPFNRLMPFHRIRVPNNHVILVKGPFINRVISGDAYSVGARSNKDYDGAFGEELGKELADFVENLFPILKVPGQLTHALAAFIGKIPGLGALAKALDGFDPLKELFKKLGNAFDSLLVESFIRGIPAWVPTFDEKLHPEIQFLEIDGILVRSYQRIDAIPFWQWNRWYDWHFDLVPSPLFEQLIGFGNQHRNDPETKGDKDQDAGELLGIPKGSGLINYHEEGLPIGATRPDRVMAECEWDIGALGIREGPPRSPKETKGARFPVFFDQIRPRVKHDWCWPMGGMFFWAIGRSVYDCRFVSQNNAQRTKRDKRKPQGEQFTEEERLQRGVHMNQLHPMKALATARWEAHQFKENPKPVPAIQFMFYANVHLSSAGFFDKNDPHRSGCEPLNQEDYEFIVDLPPPVVTAKSEYPVGHTPEFALNTLVLQPRLVFDFQFKQFLADGSNGPPDGILEDADDHTTRELNTNEGPQPVVEVFGAKANEPPRQAKVRIPLKGISKDINAYGELISMGWLDPDSISVSTVKKVTVDLLQIRTALKESDMDWNLNIGVNGRWFNFRFDASSGNTVDLAAVAGGPVKIEMLLAEEDQILVSAHGFEEDPLDDIIRLAPEFVGRSRPKKDPPKLPPVTDPGALAQFKVDTLERLKVLDDRILRLHAEADVPKGLPDPKTGIPTTKVKIPLVGKEIEWADHIDTDDDAIASDVARSMFLRLAIGNRFDANDLLGMFDANQRDPKRTNKAFAKSQDSTDSANPLVVKDVIAEVGIGKTKRCQLSAYQSTVAGRMRTLLYNPKQHEYTLVFDVTVEDLPKNG